MKRKSSFCFIIIIVCLALCLSGCSAAGTIWANYREIAQLRLIQTLGVDTAPSGLRLTVSTGAGAGGTSEDVLSREDSSITLAMASLQDYTTAQQLYYAQSRHIVFSEEYAAEGIGRWLDYVQSAADVRLSTTLFVLRGASAQELMTSGTDITECLNSVQRDADSRGDTHAFTCGETARWLADFGAALICALRAESEEGSVFSEGETGLTAVPDGFGVLVGKRVADYIDADDAVAACILTGLVGLAEIQLSGGDTVVLNRADVSIKPQWSGGKVARVEISIDAAAVLAESAGSGGSDPEALGALLTRELYERASRVLALEKELDADFLGLGASIRADSAQKFDALTEPWLTGAELTLSVSAAVEPTDIPHSAQNTDESGASTGLGK